MGAIDAFGKTIDFIAKNPKILVIPLIFAFLIAPINAYILKDVPLMMPQELQTFEKEGSVIIEEHGMTMDMEGMMDLIRKASISALIELVLMSIALYALAKGAFLVVNGSEFTLSALLTEGTKKMPAVVLIRIVMNLFGALLALVFLSPGIILIGAGVLGTPALIGLGALVIVVLSIPVLGYIFTIISTAVPAYVVGEDISSAFSVIGLAWKKKLSSIGFGLLLALAIVLISIIPASFGGIAFLGSSGFAPQLVLQLLSAPFQALSIALQAIGGFMFYSELTKVEEPLEEFDLEF
ncbi:hypothetical protein PAP_08080 [Palaeococcus pacificus DY20341]|uniref:Glycerophosphoryl diester phosphodiesterase membrane domain-containing protein n=2 Tax=Palaeococcus TaxID=83867 RepID=A0A075LUF6_9EURY|nr:hypothetical protein PAP_08080 [Palaeococcus pacificus DY20341]